MTISKGTLAGEVGPQSIFIWKSVKGKEGRSGVGVLERDVKERVR